MKYYNNKFILYYIYFFKFLIFYLLLFAQPSNSSSIHNKSIILEESFKSNSTQTVMNTIGFVDNTPILKSYGPLILDINNVVYNSYIFIIPMLNIDYKPLFLAINCKESTFNIKDLSEWKTWFTPFFTYEINILNDFCSF